MRNPESIYTHPRFPMLYRFLAHKYPEISPEASKSEYLARPLQDTRKTIMSSDEDETLSNVMFQEPDDYFEPEKPCTHNDYTLLSGQKLRVRLVGHNPLWVPAHE